MRTCCSPNFSRMYCIISFSSIWSIKWWRVETPKIDCCCIRQIFIDWSHLMSLTGLRYHSIRFNRGLISVLHFIPCYWISLKAAEMAKTSCQFPSIFIFKITDYKLAISCGGWLYQCKFAHWEAWTLISRVIFTALQKIHFALNSVKKKQALSGNATVSAEKA